MFFLLFLFVFNQAKTSSLLSAEMTNTVIRMKKKDLSFHVGLEGRSPHSFNKSTWMEERALFFLGTKNTEQFTRKHCCITLIQARRDRSLNINRNITRKYPAEAKKVKQKTKIRLNKINTIAMQHSFVAVYHGIHFNVHNRRTLKRVNLFYSANIRTLEPQQLA